MSSVKRFKLFVYGGLMDYNIRRYKGLHKLRTRPEPALLRGYRMVWNRAVNNTPGSKYYVAGGPEQYAMLNVIHGTNSDQISGYILDLSTAQWQQIMSREVGYGVEKLATDEDSSDHNGTYILIAKDPQYLRDDLEPNPIYRRLVEAARPTSV